MPALETLQQRMCRVIRGTEDPVLAALVADDGIPAEARLRIYRNHAFLTLIDALKATYPVVCRLVDERFFSYAAHEYVRETVPSRPCLVEYGASFPEFLEDFQACREIVYLPDVARLEWAINASLHAEEAAPIDRAALRDVPVDATPNLVLTLHPSFRLLRSPWPVDRIWRANRPGAAEEVAIDLDAGGARLRLHRRDDSVVLTGLAVGTHAFLDEIARGTRLELAAGRALAVDPLFDLPIALRALFDEGLITGWHLAAPVAT